jgi:hypothetical protein
MLTHVNPLWPPHMTAQVWHKLTLSWRVSSSGKWRRVVRWVSTDVSDDHIASIFRVEEIGSANQRASRWRYVPPKRPLKLNGLHRLHGVISQKMILFITTAVKTSNPTRPCHVLLFRAQQWNCAAIFYRRFYSRINFTKSNNLSKTEKEKSVSIKMWQLPTSRNKAGN